MKLRDYQLLAQQNTIDAWKAGNRSALGVMPTGCGKTVVFASIIRRMFPKRAMVLAHRQELIWQARDKIQKVTGMRVDVEMGEYKASIEKNLLHPNANVIVSTVQTHAAGGDGGGRISKFDPMDFGLVIVDEAHHATADSYKKILEYYKQNPNLVILGVTATPDRADEEALGQIFDTVAFDYEILDAIHDGWLCPIEQQMVSVDGLDFSDIRTTAGDLNGADLAAVMESEKNLHGIAGPTIDIIGSRRGLGFASSVAHAKTLCDIFNRHKPGMAAWVCGKTDKDERKKIVSDFASGRIQFLWNCGVFTEGFDDSGVEVISMARPTKSRALYAQCCGRGTRPHESIAHRLNDLPAPALRRMAIQRSVKPSCLIIDFVGNSGRHKLMTTADILGGNVSEEAIEAAITTARKAGKPVQMAELLEDEEKRLEEKKKREIEEAARKAKLVAKTSYKTKSIDPFDVFQIKPVVERGWHKGKTLSPKQRDVLRNCLETDPDKIDFASGKRLIDEYFSRKERGLCTLRQANKLKQHGFNPNSTYEQAQKILNALANNGWSAHRARAALGTSDLIPPRPKPAAAQPAADDDNIPF